MSASEPSFYITGGTLRHDAPSYVERQADRDLLDGLLRGEFCYVLTSRQMGKSSLMVRTAIKLRDRGAHVIVMDLTAVGQNLTPEQWYDGLVVRMGRQLRLEDELETFWRANGRLGPCQRLFAALHDVVMIRRAGSLVIFVDEIDTVRSLPFPVDEFFAAIRECYNRRSEDAEFNRLTFCLLGVATPSDLIRDTRTTPFNIGRRIELHDFTRAEAATLAQGLKHLGATKRQPSGAPSAESTGASDGTAGQLLTRIFFWTNGHPYLTQRFCRAVAEGASIADASGVDRLCEELFLSSRALERDDNLLFVRERLLRSEADITSLLELYLRVRAGRSVADDETSQLVTVLRLAGIVTARDGRLEERNRIYRQVFDSPWVRAHLPDADLQRQKAAFRRGVLRTTAIAAVVVAALAVTVAIAVNEAKKARRALAQAYFSQAQATRVSGNSGQRFESLDAIMKAIPAYPDHAALRNVAISSLALMDMREGRVWPGCPPGSMGVALAADFRVYARGDAQGDISVRTPTNDQQLVMLRGTGVPSELLLFSPDSRWLAAKHKLGSTNELVVWDWREQRALLRLPEAVNGKALDFSPDSQRIAWGDPSGRIQIHSLATGKLMASLSLKLATKKERPPNCIRFDPAGKRLAESCNVSLYVQVWDLESEQMTSSFAHRSAVASLAWHPGGELLAAGCASGEIYLWDRLAPRSPKVLYGHEAEVSHLAFNHHGDVIASCSFDKTIRLWITSTARQMVYQLESGHVGNLQFREDDSGLGFDCIDSKIRLWDVNPGREYRILAGRAGTSEELKSIDFSPDGRLLVAASDDGIMLWDPGNGRKLKTLTSEVSSRSALFDPTTGDLLLSSGMHGLRRRPVSRLGDSGGLQLRLGSPRPNMRGLPDDLAKIALSANGLMAAVPSGDKVYLLNPNHSAEISALTVGRHSLALALSADGEFLAVGATDGGGIEMWNARRLARMPDLPEIASGQYFSFSPDGQWFVTGTASSFRFWRVGTWQQEREFKRSGNQPGPMAFSRDARLFAMTDSTSAIEIIQMPEGRSIARLDGPDRTRLLWLAFSPDSRRLAAACTEQLVLVWDLALLTHELSKMKLEGELREHVPSLDIPSSVKLEVEIPEQGTE